MEDAKAVGGNSGDVRQIIAWVALLFGMIFVCLLPFLVGGVTLPNLGQLRVSSPLFALCILGFTLVGYTPTLSALLVARFAPCGGGVRSVLRQAKVWRAGVGWYVIALFGPAALFLLAGSIGEEFGWRGFAQPRLQSRYGALAASVMVGLVWGTFHLWIMPICPHCLSLTDVVVTQYLRLIGTAVIYAWLYNSSDGSLFLVMIAHAAHNLTVDLMPQVGGSSVMVGLSYVVVAIVVALVTDPRTLKFRSRQELVAGG